MLEWRRRVLATVRSRRFSAASATQGGFFELRSDQISPGALSRYLDDVERTAETRKRPGFLGMWKTELGGSVQTVHHLYHWNSYTERDEARELTSDETDFHKGISHTETLANMTLPLPMLRESICDSKSLIMNEALPCLQMAGLPGALGFMPPSAVVQPEGASLVAYEMRTYQLQLGYSTVPKFLELYGEGLKDKLAADDSGASELCTLLYTGASLASFSQGSHT